MAKQRSAGREVAISLTAAVVLGGGFAYWLEQSIQMPEPPKLTMTGSASGQRAPAGPSDVDRAEGVAKQFVGQLAAGQHAAAYALMAEPYRQAFSLEDFQRTCAGSPFLSGAQRAIVRRTRRMATESKTYSMLGMGLLVGSAGSVETDFTFLVTGSELRLLVLSIAGVPVLDGVRGKPPSPSSAP